MLNVISESMTHHDNANNIVYFSNNHDQWILTQHDSLGNEIFYANSFSSTTKGKLKMSINPFFEFQNPDNTVTSGALFGNKNICISGTSQLLQYDDKEIFAVGVSFGEASFNQSEVMPDYQLLFTNTESIDTLINMLEKIKSEFSQDKI